MSGVDSSSAILLIRTWVIWDKKTSVLIAIVMIGITTFGSMLISFVLWTRSLLRGSIILKLVKN